MLKNWRITLLFALVAMIAIWIQWWASLGFPLDHEICSDPKTHDDCDVYDILLYSAWAFGKAIDRWSTLITAVATGAIGYFTLTLKRSTDRLWEAGKDQLTHARDEAASAEHYRDIQFDQISQQITALEQSAEAAENQVAETRELVLTSHLNAQRQLRAYIVAGANSVNIKGPEDAASVSMQVVIKNTGQTPAHDLTVVSKTELLEHPIKMPFDFTLISGPDPSRAVLGAGETTESESRAERPFNGDEMMVAAEPEAGARIYTWGSVTYRDVFGHQHYTNFCSSLIFDGSEAIAHASEHHNDAS